MRDPGSGWLQLHAVELSLLWSAMGLGDTPAVLDLVPVGRTAARRAELVATASRGLAARDLGTVTEPARDLAGVVHALGTRTSSLDMRVYGAGEPLFAFAGAGPSGAAIAARVGDEVRVGAVRAPALAATLLGSLTPLPAAPGRPVNVTVADYAAACADDLTTFTRALHAAGLRQADVSLLATALTTRTGGGQLGATGRHRGVVTWLDTPTGRYALRRHGDWLTVTPTDLPRLTSMAADLLADVS